MWFCARPTSGLGQGPSPHAGSFAHLSRTMLPIEFEYQQPPLGIDASRVESRIGSCRCFHCIWF